MIEIKLEDQALKAELQALQGRIAHPASLMQAIATELESQTQQSFADQRQYGGEKWQDLSGVTKKMRAKSGHADSPILNISGGRGLLGSVMSSSSATTASVGAGSGKSALYATIHQFGGQAGRGRKVTIPARPYLPMRKNGSDLELAPKASESILGLMRDLVDGRIS